MSYKVTKQVVFETATEAMQYAKSLVPGEGEVSETNVYHINEAGGTTVLDAQSFEDAVLEEQRLAEAEEASTE